MANMKIPAIKKPLKISKFLGLNLDVNGDTQLQLGESGDMTNFYIDKDFNLKKMEGYKGMLPSQTTDSPIRGLWYGNLLGQERFVFAFNGNLYVFDDGYWQDYTQWDDLTWLDHVTNIGTLTDADTRFFVFDNKVYCVNGHEYLTWTGTGVFSAVVGYVPKIAIATPPSGGGTDFEQLNVLSTKKRMTFSGDASATVYQLRETSIASVDFVKVDGVLMTVTTDYTVNLTNGTVTPVPASKFTVGVDNVEIQWDKDTTDPTIVTKNRAGTLFGPNNNTRVFLYGNEDAKNRIVHSGLADGIPSVEYFPSNGFLDVASSNNAVTDIKRQYSRMIVTKDSMEGFALDYEQLTVEGDLLVTFSVSPLNQARGNVAFAQGQVINNSPITIDNSLVLWVGTNVLDEKNVYEVSEKINPDLIKLDLTKAKTVDWQERWEHWTSVDKTIYLYNYQLSSQGINIFSKLEIAHTPTCFMVVKGDLYFGTEEGKIMKFDDLFDDYDGTTIVSHWEMNFEDFGASNLRKTMNRLWVSMFPEPRASAIINYISDVKGGTNPKTIEYALFSYNRIDYADWSYNTNYNPQPFRLKMKAKKFTFLKITIDNNNTDKCTILNLDIKYEYGGESK